MKHDLIIRSCVLAVLELLLASCDKNDNPLVGKWTTDAGSSGSAYRQTIVFNDDTEEINGNTFQITYKKEGNYMMVFLKNSTEPGIKVKVIDKNHIELIKYTFSNGNETGLVFVRQ
jgi:hypothetical protein